MAAHVRNRRAARVRTPQGSHPLARASKRQPVASQIDNVSIAVAVVDVPFALRPSLCGLVVAQVAARAFVPGVARATLFPGVARGAVNPVTPALSLALRTDLARCNVPPQRPHCHPQSARRILARHPHADLLLGRKQGAPQRPHLLAQQCIFVARLAQRV